MTSLLRNFPEITKIITNHCEVRRCEDAVCISREIWLWINIHLSKEISREDLYFVSEIKELATLLRATLLTQGIGNLRKAINWLLHSGNIEALHLNF